LEKPIHFEDVEDILRLLDRADAGRRRT